MKLFLAFAAAMGMASLGVGDVIQGISSSLLARFEVMSTLCMSSYVGNLCLSPGGLDKVATITNKETDIHGWVLRDDDTKEIIVVFRGTLSLQNYETDTNYTLASFDILPECEGCQVHGGYYLAWVSVVDQVQALLEQQTRQNPGYRVVITGHSLGGSLAALAGAQFASSFDDIQVYTLGEPRTGNAAFAAFVEDAYNASSPDTTRFFRCTHENDGIPKEPPASLGYTHHGVEYWSLDPTSAENTYVCTGDAIQCCEAQDGEGINAAHLTYFGHAVIIGADCL